MAANVVDTLLELGQASRTLRAYAYMTASLKNSNSVEDALDCLLPFLASGIAAQDGSALSISRLAQHLSALGLNIPIYVIQYLVPRLQKRGLLEWSQVAHHHICRAAPAHDDVGGGHEVLTSTVFDEIEIELTDFAASNGVAQPPASPTWNDALIYFLRFDSASTAARSVIIKGALIGDTKQLESYIVASFIKLHHSKHDPIYDMIVKIFTGVLIEDFVSNIQEIGNQRQFSNLHIYYDTTLLLRMLGTSGSLHQTAALEMHRNLQDLGCKTFFMRETEAEASNILSGLIHALSIGKEIYGETADAIADRDISISDIKDLEATFVARLGHLNIFQHDYNFGARRMEDVHQIDEAMFSSALISEAMRRDRGYSKSSADSDAHIVALIMRLRRGRVARELSSCVHLLVSHNNLFQKVARNFVLDHVEDYDHLCVPPVLTSGQISTVAWLSVAAELKEKKVGRELLSACYNAVRPSSQWTDEFASALAKFRQENPDFVEQRANQMIFLQTARRTVREESLGQAAILRQLNFAELLQRAAKAAEDEQYKQQQALADLESKKEKEKTVAMQQAANAEAISTSMRMRAEQNSKLEALANAATRWLLLTLRFLSAILILLMSFFQGTYFYVTFFLAIIAALSWLDLTGWKVVSEPARRLQTSVSVKLYHWLRRRFGF